MTTVVASLILAVSALATETKVRVAPSIKAVESISPTEFKITYNWKVYENTFTDWSVLVHFTDEEGVTKFQDDFTPDPGTSTWKIGEDIEEERTLKFQQGRTGTFYIRIGLYNAEDMENVPRPNIIGEEDIQRRILVGTLTFADGNVEFQPLK